MHDNDVGGAGIEVEDMLFYITFCAIFTNS